MVLGGHQQVERTRTGEVVAEGRHGALGHRRLQKRRLAQVSHHQRPGAGVAITQREELSLPPAGIGAGFGRSSPGAGHGRELDQERVQGMALVRLGGAERDGAGLGIGEAGERLG